MHSDTNDALKGLKSKTSRLRTRIIRFTSIRDKISADIEEKRSQIASLSSRVEVLTKVIELYRVLLDKLILNQVNSVQSIVTEGLQAIYYDQDLRFNIELSFKYNKVSADPFICVGDPLGGGVKGHPLESFGGGPASVVSLILRILILLRSGKSRVLFLDESLNAVSDEYIESTAQFIQKLFESTGLHVFLVTHKAAFVSSSNLGYVGDLVGDGETTRLEIKSARDVNEKNSA